MIVKISDNLSIKLNKTNTSYIITPIYNYNNIEMLSESIEYKLWFDFVLKLKMKIKYYIFQEFQDINQKNIILIKEYLVIIV